jgi:hypothetical protein
MQYLFTLVISLLKFSCVSIDHYCDYTSITSLLSKLFRSIAANVIASSLWSLLMQLL